MMIEPPGLTDWLLLLALGTLAGAISALRGYSSAKTMADRLVVGVMEGATTVFVTITTFLLLHSLLPLLNIHVSTVGLVAAGAMVAHFGLRETVLLILRIRASVK